MKKYLINGSSKLSGKVQVSGGKNAVLKALIAACLTDSEVEIKNVPLISDFYVMLELIKEIGGEVKLLDHVVRIRVKEIKEIKIPLEMGAKIRTSFMFVAPLLARCNKAIIPNPGGCRIGARPIERHIKGLELMGAHIIYNSKDGYFYAETDGLKGTTYEFEKNTHTGTETLILAAVLARGQTVLKNCALEPEVDELIALLNKMGAKIKREKERTIVIDGVNKLNGCSFDIACDRNEIVTFAIASSLTGGNIWIEKADIKSIESFLDRFKLAGGSWEEKDSSVRFYFNNGIKPVDVTTSAHPGFMTDWQGPWAILMTQADGISIIHETVYENRFGYVEELKKMGAKIDGFNPRIDNPDKFYNFNYEDAEPSHKHAIKIHGATKLHNGIVNITDLRAGATLVLASLIAKGESVVYGIEHLERGYESFDERLRKLGASIQVLEEEDERQF